MEKKWLTVDQSQTDCASADHLCPWATLPTVHYYMQLVPNYCSVLHCNQANIWFGINGITEDLNSIPDSKVCWCFLQLTAAVGHYSWVGLEVN